MPIPPWASGPFELILHGESHLRRAQDFDRRISLISFDNAIEVAITTYLTLQPIQRGNRSYERVRVSYWMNNYHTRLEFLEEELQSRNMPWAVDKSHIVWAHDYRNEQYHGGQKGTPELNVLEVVRSAALWVFSMLFDVENPQEVLERELSIRSDPSPPSPERQLSLAIDEEYGITMLGEQHYYTSEALFAIDQAAYRDLGEKLINQMGSEVSDESES